MQKASTYEYVRSSIDRSSASTPTSATCLLRRLSCSCSFCARWRQIRESQTSALGPPQEEEEEERSLVKVPPLFLLLLPSEQLSFSLPDFERRKSEKAERWIGSVEKNT